MHQKIIFDPKSSIRHSFSLSPSELGTAQSQLVQSLCFKRVSLVQGLLVAWQSSLRLIFYFWIKHSAKLKNPSLKLPSLAKRLRLIMLGWFVWIRTSIHYGRRRRSHWAILPKPALSLVNLRVLFQKLCLEMAFFRNFKYVFWRLQGRCLKFENCFGITGLILLKWDIVQHDQSLGEKVDFSLVTEMWPYKHVVPWDNPSILGAVAVAVGGYHF